MLLFDQTSSRCPKGKILKIRGLAPNQNWPTYFFQSSKKKLFLLPHINSKEGYLGKFLNICPELKLQPVFKKVLNSKVRI
jgi:hypothetical protein